MTEIDQASWSAIGGTTVIIGTTIVLLALVYFALQNHQNIKKLEPRPLSRKAQSKMQLKSRSLARGNLTCPLRV